MSEDRYDYGACYEDAGCRERVESELEQVRADLRRAREAMIEFAQEASASRERASRAECSLVQARAASRKASAAWHEAASRVGLTAESWGLHVPQVFADQIEALRTDLVAAQERGDREYAACEIAVHLMKKYEAERDAARREAERLREALSRSYRRIDLPSDEGVQYVGVYTTRWGRVDEPTVAFREWSEEEIAALSASPDTDGKE